MMPFIAELIPAILEALDRASVGVLVVGSRNGTLEKLYANAALATSLGYTPEEMLAAPMWYVISPRQKAGIASLFERISSTGEIPLPATVEATLLHRDGHEIHAEVAGGRVMLESGPAIACVVRDMSIHRQRQLTLLESDRLELVGALAAGFAHETNNPLTSVLLNLRSLRKQVTANMPEQTQMSALRCLDDITTGSERIASNVRALQTLATRSSTQMIDVVSVVSSALRLAAPTLEPRAHVIRQIFPVAQVTGEESRIGQAILAMLLFASSGFDSETTATNNRIVVAVEQREGQVVVEVSDNGRELTQDEAEHAFDPFFRSTVRGSGVGVGLGVARSVAMTLGGDVVLAPRTGGGAIVTMRLPVAPTA